LRQRRGATPVRIDICRVANVISVGFEPTNHWILGIP
jgi:hypothetical protein